MCIDIHMYIYIYIWYMSTHIMGLKEKEIYKC